MYHFHLRRTKTYNTGNRRFKAAHFTRNPKVVYVEFYWSDDIVECNITRQALGRLDCLNSSRADRNAVCGRCECLNSSRTDHSAVCGRCEYLNNSRADRNAVCGRLECLNSSRADRNAVYDWSWMREVNSFMLNFLISVATVTPLYNAVDNTALLKVSI